MADEPTEDPGAANVPTQDASEAATAQPQRASTPSNAQPQGPSAATTAPQGVPPKGREPSREEALRLATAFPTLSRFTVTDEPTRTYNCAGFTVKPYDPEWIWPPDRQPTRPPKDVLDDFYRGKGMTWMVTEPRRASNVVAVALYATDTPTHVALRIRDDPEWWESKLGPGWRIVHRLRELEGPAYGRLVGFYWKEI